MNNKTGILTEVQRISVFPSSTITHEQSSPVATYTSQDMTNEKATTIKVGDIRITPDGKWLYVSERATNTITAFSFDHYLGNLISIGSYDTEKVPRGITLILMVIL